MLVEADEVLAAQLSFNGEITVPMTLTGRLVSKKAGQRRGTALLDEGQEVLIDHLPEHVTEGMKIWVNITRAPIAERGRYKTAQGRCVMTEDWTAPKSKDGPVRPWGHWSDFLLWQDAPQTRSGLWEEVWHAASSGSIAFDGGEILCAVTPGMSVIDIDGELPPRELALAAIPAISKALRWFDMGGNIGIDFPTLQAKTDRRAVDETLADALSDWPHERTAMNGFGFVQIVARLEGPSLLHRFATSRVGMCARYALRVAERAEGIGPVLLLTVHPALKAKLKPEWLEQLAKRTGREVRIETNPALALEAPQAQIIAQ